MADKDDTKIYTDKIAALEQQIAELTPEAAASKTYKAELDALKKNLSDGKRGVMSGRVRVFNQRAEQVFEFSEKLMMRRGRVDNLV